MTHGLFPNPTTMKYLRVSLLLLPLIVLGSVIRGQSPAPSPSMQPKPYGLVVHGGAGVIARETMTPQVEHAYRTTLAEALASGYSVLERGGASVDATIAAVRVLEDSPLFNAGHGAVMTAEGLCELDAAIMDGQGLRAGAVAGVRHIRNPILLARDVMEKSNHVMLTGEGAEKFAQSLGYDQVPNEYFQTERRRLQLEKAKEIDRNVGTPEHVRNQQRSGGEFAFEGIDPMPERKWGTVGAVALDQAGNLAAATSTGGMTNKKFGRVGDSPIIGAGNYADNHTCAVSATGHGEYFIRATVAYSISARMAFGSETLAAAARHAIETVGTLGGTGGVIAIDRQGNIATPFNTPGMYRGVHLSSGKPLIEIFQSGP